MRRSRVSSLAAVVALACATMFAGTAYAGPSLKIEDYDPACVATVIPDWSKVQGWSPEQIDELIAQRCLPITAAIDFTAFDPVNNSDDSNNFTVHVVGNEPAANGPDNGGNNGQCGGSCGIGNDGNGTQNESGTGGNAGGNQDRVNGNSGENGNGPNT